MPKVEKYVKFNAFRILCLKNAEDNLKGAEILLDKGLNHLVFHLCLLSLEEIGKIFMSWIKINQVENWDRETMNVAMDDHVQKLFFAIWGPSIGQEIIDKDQWNENKYMARKLHELRLFSLYGAMEDAIPSSFKLPNEEVKAIYSFTKARLSLAEIDGEVKEDVEEGNQPNTSWFDEYLQLPGKKDFAFGSTGQEKLVELGDVNEWINWLKQQHEEEEKELTELAEKEISKPETIETESFIPKWELSFTIVTPSHSIRKKELNSYNKHGRPIKLEVGKDKHTLIIKHTFPSIVTVHTLWQQAWITSKFFVAALNIASRGLFYWHAPRDTSIFYDKILDLESGKRLTLSIDAKLNLDWQSHKLVLNEQQLHLAHLVYEYFLMNGHKDRNEISDYMLGLAMFARTDIHLRLDTNAFMIFYDVFRRLVTRHEKFSGEDVFEVGYQQIEKLLTTKTEFDKCIKIAKAIESKSQRQQELTLTEVLAMKWYCDFYFLTIAVRIQQNMPGARLVPDNHHDGNEEDNDNTEKPDSPSDDFS